jgi:hypothetical protein
MLLGANASASASASAHDVRIVSSSAASIGWGGGPTGAWGGCVPVLDARIWQTLTPENSLPLWPGRRPSKLRLTAGPAAADSKMPCAPRSSGISRACWPGPFQMATTGDGLCPGGRERCAMPNEVSVSTAEPGSSARTRRRRGRRTAPASWRAAHRGGGRQRSAVPGDRDVPRDGVRGASRNRSVSPDGGFGDLQARQPARPADRGERRWRAQEAFPSLSSGRSCHGRR